MDDPIEAGMDDQAATRSAVEAASRGDREAFGRLAVVWAPRLVALARAIVGDSEAEDIAQETLARAWRRLGDLEDVGAFDGWLCAIARNLARNRNRDRRRADARETQHVVPGHADDPAHEDAAQALRDAVNGLPQEQREVVRLRYEAGMSYLEIASALVIDPGLVRSRLAEARKALRRQLD